MAVGVVNQRVDALVTIADLGIMRHTRAQVGVARHIVARSGVVTERVKVGKVGTGDAHRVRQR